MNGEKTKKAPQLRRSSLAVWLTLTLLPLVMFISVFFVQGMMASYVRDLLSPAGPSLIYLPMLINDSEQLGCIATFSLSLFVVYMLLIRKYSPRAAIAFWGIVVAFLLGLSTLLAGGSTGVFRYNKTLQTLSTNDHIYQLVDQAECHHGCSHSYVVLECDPSGWTCHNYGTSSQRDMLPQPCDQPVPIVSLAQNPATQRLELTVDSETSTVNPSNAILIYGYSWDRCGLGGLKR